MEKRELIKTFAGQSRTVFPLLRYLVLRTETHAFCLALACAALIGFYPFCFLLLSFAKYLFRWERAYAVVIAAIYEYYPTSQEFFIRNLETSVQTTGARLEVSSIFWILLGAAGVFIPLESGLNRLWKVEADRSYWRNQLVGLSLTTVCCVLAIAFVAITASLQSFVRFILLLNRLAEISNIFLIIRNFSDLIILKLVAICFSSIAILLFYKFLPNRKIRTMQILPAAILAGIVAEIVKDLYVLALPLMNMERTQGPFVVSVSFVILAYFETFVLLGGAFLSTQENGISWSQFFRLWKKPKDEAESGP